MAELILRAESAPANPVTRRTFIAGAGLATVLAAAPLAIAAQSPDAALEAAWQRRAAAYERYNALPDFSEPGEAYTPQEAACWAAIAEAEEIIRATVARTPGGVAIQLWTLLAHCTSSREDDAAVTRRDLAHFDRAGKGLDSNERLALSALRSLEAMGA